MVQNISITILPSSYSVYDQAKFFAKLGAAFYDGTVTVWYVKVRVCVRWDRLTSRVTSSQGDMVGALGLMCSVRRVACARQLRLRGFVALVRSGHAM